ncbi:MAG: hypothetical protein LBR98_05980 [Syntrophomonadaceae bacterium]|jgi:hypothetical protein|nr:hypothetical protein [Syntrophomonadaceae bacterium]
MGKINKIMALFCLTIILALTGCADAANNNNGSVNDEPLKTENNIHEAEKPVLVPFKDSQAKRAYWSAVKSYIEFFSTEENSYKYLNEFDYQYDYGYDYDYDYRSVHTKGGYRDQPWEVFQFAVVDLDGDGHPEILLELLYEVEVLHYKNDGTVYGYCLPMGSMKNLKTDGTFYFLGDTADKSVIAGYGQLIFSEEKYELIKLGKYSWESDEEGKYSNVFYIAENQVTKDVYSTFEKEQAAKENVIWYEFTDENIDAMLKENNISNGLVKNEPAPETEKPIPAIFENNQAKRTYWSVLKSQSQFFSSEENAYKYLNEFDYKHGDHLDKPWEVLRFAVADLDGDKNPEVLLELFDQVEVLHYEKGTVYGYFFPYRGLKRLKTDGTFNFASSAAAGGFARLMFSKNNYEYIKLVESVSRISVDGKSKYEILFYIADRRVSEEDFRTFVEGQDEKEDVIWYEFTDENIDAMLK